MLNFYRLSKRKKNTDTHTQLPMFPIVIYNNNNNNNKNEKCKQTPLFLLIITSN